MQQDPAHYTPKRNMRVFVLGLPHTKTSVEFCSCAFTMKVLSLSKMLTDRGHEVVHFGNEGSNPVCAENVAVMKHDQWAAVYNHPGANHYDVAVDTPVKQAFYRQFAWNLEHQMRARLTDKLDTIICVTWGGAQQEAAQKVADKAFVIESGIGYVHSWAEYRVFESYAWLHATLGKEGLLSGEKWYWPVIPNAFDVSMFDFGSGQATGILSRTKDDYFLYLGRLQPDKGVSLAVDLAKRMARKIILAGQGDPTPYLAGHVDYLGPVDVDTRRDLLAGAAALICPTYYVEPFGGVAVEAQLSGTPVITTDWGAYAETVLHGVTGYRCRTMEQFEWAARHLDEISSLRCREWAESNFSLERVGAMYEEYFQMLLDLTSDGFYASRPDRRDLDWLRPGLPD